MKNTLKNNNGFSLIEAVIAVVIMSVIMFSLVSLFQVATNSLVKTRSQIKDTRLGQMIFSKLKTIDYYMLFDINSSSPNFGLNGTFGNVSAQSPTYPYMGVLIYISSITKAYSIDRWTVEIQYVLRDLSDINGNGLTSDLRDFIDNNKDLIDDYDSGIKYTKNNADSDYYDTFSLTGKTVSEVPDTNIKKVTLRFYRNNQIRYQQSELISLEMLKGIESKASGSEIVLLVDEPPNDSYLYRLDTTARQNSFNLTISKAYPDYIISRRADNTSSLKIMGETSPVAVVKFYLETTGTVLDQINADYVGNFSFVSPNITTKLNEGENMILAQATKDTYYSPIAERRVILDLVPPVITNIFPTIITKNNLMPYVGAVLSDISSTGTPSGICQEVITMKSGSNEINYRYNSGTGDIYWLDANTGLPSLLSNGNTYIITLEGGDNAYYKVKSTWTFTINIPAVDNTPPVITDKSPVTSTSLTMPEISCKVSDPESGININSIIMKLDNNVIVSSANISRYYEPKTGCIKYTPQNEFSIGSYHTVDIWVSHWAASPADKITANSGWSFNVTW